MKKIIKKTIVHFWAWLYLRKLIPSMQDKAVIFMLHRMSAPYVIEKGHAPELLEAALRYLSKKGFRFVSVEDILKNIRDAGEPLKKAVAFTLDDGFVDQAKIAAPIFIKYKCPATIFLITGFIDGDIMPWDVCIKYIFNKTKKEIIKIDAGDKQIEFNIRNEKQRYDAMNNFRTLCKELPEQLMKSVIENLSNLAEVDIDETVFNEIQPLCWDDARQLEASGINFGPHTVNHLILSRLSDERAQEEIVGAWERIRAELKHPSPVFAFPTGRFQDFLARDIDIIKKLGLMGALTTEQGYVEGQNVSLADCFLIKRYAFPRKFEDFIQYCTGLEYFKRSLKEFKLYINYVGKYEILSRFINLIKFRMKAYKQFEQIDWKRVSRLVFLCKGNICRSPYAEAKAKQDGIDVVSAGLYTENGLAANEKAKERALYRGVNLNAHKTKTFQSIELRESDLVICMEPWQIEEFKKMNSVNCQTTLMGLWCTKSEVAIIDPYAKSDLFFDKCFRLIDNGISNMNKKLVAAID